MALATLAEYPQLYVKVLALRDPSTILDVGIFYERIKAFDALLDAFSSAEPVVNVTTSSLACGTVLESLESIISFIENDKINPFFRFFNEFFTHDYTVNVTVPRYFGISIIGTEQIVPGLTLCRVLKEKFPNVPIIIGGSVFSRIVEKNVIVIALMERYFDYVCRYEGEKPLAAFLAAENPQDGTVPNLVYLQDGQLIMTDLTEPLDVDEVPCPDFNDLELKKYFTPHLVLPLLSTRGCYWGKCAFCYHGMIYQDRYRMRDPGLLAKDLETLHRKFGARHFAFNDEALPPKLFRILPEVIPHSQYFFTGLYKFEKFFKEEHFKGMYDVGFRSLYIGLESASERIQKHMLKNNKQRTMIDNLRYAHDAGIWNHTFNFFGFPTETAEEAEETVEFLLTNHDIIHSEGTGTFSFEHNAPISKDPGRFGITKVTQSGGVLGLYYDYEVASGLDAGAASAFLDSFRERRDAAGLYQAGSWIPREFLLLLLSVHERDQLREKAKNIESKLHLSLSSDSVYTHLVETKEGKKFFLVNRRALSVTETNADAVELLYMLKEGATVGALLQLFPEYSAVFPQSDGQSDARKIQVNNLLTEEIVH